MKRFGIVVLSLIVAISLIALVFAVKFRVERYRWIITTAEITFVGTPAGVVFGTFTDYNGKVHPDHSMYIDGKFQPYLNPTHTDPEPYIAHYADGETIIMYWGIDIESYDNWLRRFIISGIVFIVSCTPLVVVCVKTIRKKKKKSSEKQI